MMFESKREFQYAISELKLPIIIVIVGTTSCTNWRRSDIGFLAGDILVRLPSYCSLNRTAQRAKNADVVLLVDRQHQTPRNNANNL